MDDIDWMITGHCFVCGRSIDYSDGIRYDSAEGGSIFTCEQCAVQPVMIVDIIEGRVVMMSNDGVSLSSEHPHLREFDITCAPYVVDSFDMSRIPPVEVEVP